MRTYEFTGFWSGHLGVRARRGGSVYLENYYWMSSASSTLTHFYRMTCRAALLLAPWFPGPFRLLGPWTLDSLGWPGP